MSSFSSKLFVGLVVASAPTVEASVLRLLEKGRGLLTRHFGTPSFSKSPPSPTPLPKLSEISDAADTFSFSGGPAGKVRHPSPLASSESGGGTMPIRTIARASSRTSSSVESSDSAAEELSADTLRGMKTGHFPETVQQGGRTLFLARSTAGFGQYIIQDNSADRRDSNDGGPVIPPLRVAEAPRGSRGIGDPHTPRSLVPPLRVAARAPKTVRFNLEANRMQTYTIPKGNNLQPCH